MNSSSINVNDSSENQTSQRNRKKAQIIKKEKVWKINSLTSSMKVNLHTHQDDAVGNNKDYQNLILVNRKRGSMNESQGHGDKCYQNHI